MTKQRVLIDSNILIDGIVSNWSASKAFLIVARETRLFDLLVAQTSVEEIEDFFDRKGIEKGKKEFREYLKYVKVKILPMPTKNEAQAKVKELLPLLRHISDLPIVVTAINNQVDWIVSNNRDHFNDDLAEKIRIKIASSQEFLKKFELIQE